MRSWLALPLFLATLAASASAFAQAKSEISITRQPGILYLASHVMEARKMVEGQAAKAGVANLKVNWLILAGGGAQTDALLSGNVDVVNTGTGNLLLLWDRTRGRVRGIVASSAQPVLLLSREARIKSLSDIRPTDKIAVPTVGVSTQAILLQMAAAKMFGDANVNRFDQNTVQLSHPDAMALVLGGAGEVASHFSAPPFQYLAIAKGLHIVANSKDIIGGPLSQAQFFTTTQYADANPVVVKALRAATAEAIAFIKANPRDALVIYKEITGDKAELDDLVKILAQPDMMDFIMEPQGTMKFAEHLFKIGTLKTMPKAWTDYYLPTSADLKGN
ncbi:MAG: ABC transporter substrate-binding protein [Proteobacteria bacterium]|nr:ABC transporter substrate-binding protein [Pseudomonadota bacterium]